MLGLELIAWTDSWTQRRITVRFQDIDQLQPAARRLVEHLGERAVASETSRMNALRGLAILLLLQAAGEALTHAFGLPFPGPVVGLLLLLIVLQWPAVRASVSATAEFLLAHLSLLFVPVGVGVITHLDLVSHYGLQLLAAIVLSTWLGIAVTALVLKRLLRDDESGERP